MEAQEASNSQNNLKKEEQSWRYNTPWYESILQSYTNQNSRVMEQKHIPRSME